MVSSQLLDQHLIFTKLSQDIGVILMSTYLFHDEHSLLEKTEELGRKAVTLKLIPSFVIHYYPDSWEFCIPDGTNCNCLTAPEAYLKLKKLVESVVSTV